MPAPALRTILLGTLLLSLLVGCARARRTVIEEEVGGIGTAWVASDTKAGLWQDQAALTSALEAALWKVAEEPASFCRGKRTKVEVVVFPSAASFQKSDADGAVREVERIQQFVQATAERRVATLGCSTANFGDGEPAALARVTVAAWGWDVEAVATVTTTPSARAAATCRAPTTTRKASPASARATVHIDIYDGSKMASASADGSSRWRVLTGRDARTWPIDQLPLIYEPPSRRFEDSFEEGR